jgi:hypothetical protein
LAAAERYDIGVEEGDARRIAMPFLRRRTASGITDTLPGSAIDDGERAEQRDAMLRRVGIASHADRPHESARTTALLGDLDRPGLTPIMVRVEQELRLPRPAGLRDGNPRRG